jgi:hypothetical protein
MAELARLRLEEGLFDRDSLKKLDHEVREALATDGEAGWSKLALPLLAGKIRGCIDQKLSEIDPVDLFVEGWSKIQELRDLPPDKRSFVRIGEYRFTKELHPIVTISFPPLGTHDIRFTLTLSVHSSAVELEVFDRHIHGAGGGTCELSMALKCKTVPVAGPTSPKPFPLLGEYRFRDPGIALPGAQSAPPAQPAPS